MRTKSQKPTDRSTATLDLGKKRKGGIDMWRGKMQAIGTPVRSYEEAVNILIDRQLESEGILSMINSNPQ